MQLITNRLHTDMLPPTAVALGSFDGLHRGHIALLNETKRAAKQHGLATCVYTFDKHPSCFKSTSPVPLLTSLPHKISLLEQCGIDYCYVEHVSEDYFNLSPETFVCRILREHCNAAFIAAGYNYRFGKKRRGTPELLQTLCRSADMGCFIQSPVSVNGEPVSSTRIRRLLAEGNCAESAALLGRPYTIRGLVSHGHRRGGPILGFPTANLYPSSALLLPPNGVYISYAVLDGIRYPAVTNIGCVPTFDERRISVETHLLSFDSDLYGRQMNVELIKNIRFEQKFDGADALRRQIDADVQSAALYFGKEKPL